MHKGDPRGKGKKAPVRGRTNQKKKKSSRLERIQLLALGLGSALDQPLLDQLLLRDRRDQAPGAN